MGMMTDVAYPAAGLALVSELIHLWVLPGQFVVAMLPAIFFLLVAISQGLLAVNLLFGAGRWTLRFGILLNLLVVFVWSFTRVVSIPELFAPVRLPVGGLDLAATAAEVALVILLVRLRRSLPPRKRERRVRRGTRRDTVESEVWVRACWTKIDPNPVQSRLRRADHKPWGRIRRRQVPKRDAQ